MPRASRPQRAAPRSSAPAYAGDRPERSDDGKPRNRPKRALPRSAAPSTGRNRAGGAGTGRPRTDRPASRAAPAYGRDRAEKSADIRPRASKPRAEEAIASRPLSAVQKRYLRGLAHDLKPVILIGQKGVTASLLTEFAGALEHHELVKVKLADDDRESRAASVERMREHSGAEVVQTIGKVACFYKRNPDRNQYPLPKK
jgi:RNA-binding protein